MNNITQGRGAGPATQPAPPANGAASGQAATGRGGRGGGFANALFRASRGVGAESDESSAVHSILPTKDGVVQPLIAAKWVANSPLVMVDQYVPSLKQYRAIAMDVGNEDT